MPTDTVIPLSEEKASQMSSLRCYPSQQRGEESTKDALLHETRKTKSVVEGSSVD
ncbi:hypothetical protein FQN60_018245 [Etheostoma spectabile]|uniref:Uncharacterized protein n=1 Tax=Etheostoma spectabile TaxID=54343 RepID=A0A5J5DHU3_9PERO|nr:hypothetical protein FQN60_018245 [Etheostoma spectabile]